MRTVSSLRKFIPLVFLGVGRIIKEPLFFFNVVIELRPLIFFSVVRIIREPLFCFNIV